MTSNDGVRYCQEKIASPKKKSPHGYRTPAQIHRRIARG